MTADAILAQVDDAKPFRVICRRFDGSERLYQRYANEQIAELVARRLRELSLEARVERESSNEVRRV